MRLTALFVGASLCLAAQASWFGTNTNTAVDPYSTWSAAQLRDWLEVHNINVPKRTPTEPELRGLVADNWNAATTWTYDQYASAQKSFTDLRDTSFDAWDESTLREFLLRQGVVAPKGPREKLVLMAKEKYRQYTQAASSYSSQASATASTLVYGDSAYQASKSVSSVVSRATSPVVAAFDDTKDYVYSTWDENQMRSFLEEKGLLKTKQQKKKEELLQMMHDTYGKVADPVWNAWSDSYMHNWLVAHNIMKSESQKTRDYYIDLMKSYYYGTSDTVWHSWSDSQLRNWLIDHNIIKSNAQVSRDKMLHMVQDNYLSAKDTFWDAWSDVQIKEWLVEHGYMRSDAQVKRDELIKAAEEKYNDYNARRAAYFTWPDARLRAYLRERGLREDLVPGERPGLLQEVRIRWVQTEHQAETTLEKIRELVNDSAHKVEDVLGKVLSLLSGGWVDVKSRSADQYGAAKEGYADVKGRTEKELRDAKNAGEERYYDAKNAGEKQYYDAKKAGERQYRDAQNKAEGTEDWMEEKWQEARENVGEKVKATGSKIKGEL